MNLKEEAITVPFIRKVLSYIFALVLNESYVKQ